MEKQILFALLQLPREDLVVPAVRAEDLTLQVEDLTLQDVNNKTHEQAIRFWHDRPRRDGQ